MKRKQAENEFVKMVHSMGWYAHKYGDVRYCPHCRGVLPKTENAPDYALGMVFTYVECKSSDTSGRWNWTEIAETGARANQRKWLKETNGWIFLTLGTGRAPNGRSAFLIPINDWIEKIEPYLLTNNRKSIRKENVGARFGADRLFVKYHLIWKDGKWAVPPNHVFLQQYARALQDALEKVNSGIR